MSRLTEGFWKARAIFDRVLGYLLLVSFLALLLFLFLFEAHNPFEGNPLGYMAVIVGLIIALSEYIAGLHNRLAERVERELAKIAPLEERMARGEAQLKRLTDTVKNAGRLFSLEGVVHDLTLRLREHAGEPLQIDHLGLNMTTAWERMCKPLQKAAEAGPVHFNLLMLRENTEKIALPAEVITWLGPARDKFAYIKKELQAMGATTTNFTSEIRTYCELPVVHGIIIRKPFEAAYVAISRWSGRGHADYHWGGDEYHCVVEPISKADRDLLNVLDGHFLRWWAINAPKSRRRRAGAKRGARTERAATRG